MLLYSLIPLGSFLFIFFWQHIARKYGWQWKPSYMLDLVTEQLVRFFSWVGRIAVWISSFYTYINIKDLYATFAELYKSVADFVFSWKAFFESYISDMKLYDHPYLITLGSITLVTGTIYLLYIYDFLWPFELIIIIMIEIVKDTKSYPKYIIFLKDKLNAFFMNI